MGDMEQNMNQYNNLPEEQEIDLVELIQKMWINRWLIIKVTAVFMVLGVLVALFSSKVFTASCAAVFGFIGKLSYELFGSAGGNKPWSVTEC